MPGLLHIDPTAALARFYERQEAKKSEQAAREADRTHGKRGQKSRHKKSAWDEKHFICWDGEGHNLPSHNEHGDSKHIYTYLANSEGDEIIDPNGLSTKACFEMLMDSAEEYPNAINAVYGGSYDMNMILRDLPKDTIEEIIASEGRAFTNVELDGITYGVRFIQRKFLAIARYKNSNALYIHKGGDNWTRNLGPQIVLWDVIGFFQGAFVQTIESWLGKDWPDLAIIREGKSKRGNFETETIEYIRKYNSAELRAFVRLMNLLHEALDDLGLRLNRWDGAGAVAAAINKKHNVKDFLGDNNTPDEIQAACQHGYFGGRIEMGKFGRHKGRVHHYDINSAYPAGMHYLPQMASGRWMKYGKLTKPHDIKSLPIITIYHVRWNYEGRGLLFGPFPYRSAAQKKVLFPAAGENWIWKPEVEAAIDQFGMESLEILGAYAWHPDSDYQPYAWIIDYYMRRQALVAQTKLDGILRGMEKVIKLGLNSLYGKTAQRAGYNEITNRIPPYHNLAYAGIITSKTRSMMWRAAMQSPQSIIAMATDGLFSMVELNLYCPKEKELGAWEYQEHDEMILVQSGFYYVRDGEKWGGWSRGFDKVQKGVGYQEQMLEQIKLICNAWKKKIDEVFFPCTRFITVKTALTGVNWWPRWCSWYSMRTPEGVKGRRLKLVPSGTKRIPGHGKPHLEMVETYPETNYTPDVISEKHNIPWIVDAPDDDELSTEECDIFNEG